jgi:endoglucanase
VQLAKDCGNTPNIIYEPWNEPTTATWAQIKSYMEEILAAVRPLSPDNLFLSGTRQWDQRPDEACANPINDPQVGYVFHFYAASHPLSTYKGSLDKCLSAKKLIWATEYGGCSSHGSGSINTGELNKWWDFMDQNLISSNAWAIETNPETSSVFVSSASSTGPWPDSQMTEWGKIVFAHVAKNYPATMSQ